VGDLAGGKNLYEVALGGKGSKRVERGRKERGDSQVSDLKQQMGKSLSVKQ
jgi:hypothetical protein